MHFQFKDTVEYFELCFHAKKSQAKKLIGEEGGIMDPIYKGWSIRPHQEPTRVSSLIIITCIPYYAL